VDRLFLDANILFSAAYRAGAGLLELWKLKNVKLCTSRYALEEARFNLLEEEQRLRLQQLVDSLEPSEASREPLPARISLPEKDVPILLGAIHARATHLLTGDVRHFGPYFGKTVAGIRIMLPAAYLKSRRERL